MNLICRKTMRECQTPGMCSPYGGCIEPGSADKRTLAYWLLAFIGTGAEMGISKEQAIKAMTPENLAAMFDIVNKDSEEDDHG